MNCPPALFVEEDFFEAELVNRLAVRLLSPNVGDLEVIHNAVAVWNLRGAVIVIRAF